LENAQDYPAGVPRKLEPDQRIRLSSSAINRAFEHFEINRPGRVELKQDPRYIIVSKVPGHSLEGAASDHSPASWERHLDGMILRIGRGKDNDFRRHEAAGTPAQLVRRLIRLS